MDLNDEVIKSNWQNHPKSTRYRRMSLRIKRSNIHNKRMPSNQASNQRNKKHYFNIYSKILNRDPLTYFNFKGGIWGANRYPSRLQKQQGTKTCHPPKQNNLRTTNPMYN